MNGKYIKKATSALSKFANIGLAVLGLSVVYYLFQILKCNVANECKDLCKGFIGCTSTCQGSMCKITGPLGKHVLVDPKKIKEARIKIAQLINLQNVSATSQILQSNLEDIGKGGFAGAYIDEDDIVGADF